MFRISSLGLFGVFLAGAGAAVLCYELRDKLLCQTKDDFVEPIDDNFYDSEEEIDWYYQAKERTPEEPPVFKTELPEDQMPDDISKCVISEDGSTVSEEPVAEENEQPEDAV